MCLIVPRASCVSTPAAHKLYPLRVRLVNDVSGEVKWATIAYIPMVRKQTETSADERSRLRRCGILQRVMYVCMRSAIAASHNGVEVYAGERVLKAFPRVLLYVCDQLEERAVLCLKTGQCQRPCSQCDVAVDVMCETEALTAEERDVVYMLERQLEASGHRQHNRERQRRETLEAVDSLTGFVPALSGMAGLSTTPYLLYKMIGFDALHVRCSLCVHATAGRLSEVGIAGCDCLFFVTLLVTDCRRARRRLTSASLCVQVLDLGVTRLLAQKLVEVFPAICGGDVPIAGSDAATRRITNGRLRQLGRRSTASRIPPGYVVPFHFCAWRAPTGVGATRCPAAQSHGFF